MNEYLVSAIRDMDKALLNPAEAGALERLAKSLPETRGAMLECHLASPQKRVDVAVRVAMGDAASESLAAEAPWPMVRAFYRHGIRHWRSADHPVFSWLEFDQPSVRVAEVNEPGLFVGQRELNSGKRGERSALLHAVLDPLAESLGLANPCRAQLCGVAPLLDKLPAGVSVHQVGLMPNRGNALKIYLRMASRAQVEACVTTFGLARQGEGEVLAQLARVRQLTDYFMLGVDLEPSGLSQQWGLECHVSRDAGQAEAWASFLGFCVEQGWCQPDQGRALQGWERMRSKTVSRQLSHIKLTSRGTSFVEAKAYLYVGGDAEPPNVRLRAHEPSGVAD